MDRWFLIFLPDGARRLRSSLNCGSCRPVSIHAGETVPFFLFFLRFLFLATSPTVFPVQLFPFFSLARSTFGPHLAFRNGSTAACGCLRSAWTIFFSELENFLLFFYDHSFYRIMVLIVAYRLCQRSSEENLVHGTPCMHSIDNDGTVQRNIFLPLQVLLNNGKRQFEGIVTAGIGPRSRREISSG